MTNILSDEDKQKMADVLKETPEEAIKRMQFWDSQPPVEYKPFHPKKAIEFDENHHCGPNSKRDKRRQKEIEKLLGCRFIRYTDK